MLKTNTKKFFLHIKKTTFTFFLCIATTTVLADTISNIRANNKVVIGYRESSIPFSYLDQNKKPIGYAIDLCLKIADAIKRDLKLPKMEVSYVPVTSNNRIAQVVDGKVDLECGSTTNNVERRKQVAFTVPHFISGVRILVKANSKMTKFNDLKNTKVVTTKGTTAIKLIADRNNALGLNINLLLGEDHADSFSMVERSLAEAFVMDDVLLLGLRANASDPSKYKLIGDSLSVEPYSIMLNKNDAQFKVIVDREMVRLMESGEFQKIYDKWFNSPIAPSGSNLKMPMGFLLRDFLHHPTEKANFLE